MNSKFFVNQ